MKPTGIQPVVLELLVKKLKPLGALRRWEAARRGHRFELQINPVGEAVARLGLKAEVESIPS